MTEMDTTRIAVLEEQVLSLRREIKEQAVEYQRRLAELNHAAAKKEAEQREYVSEDKFSGWQGEVNEWRSKVNEEMATLRGRSRGIGDLWAWLIAALGIGAAVAMYFK